MMVLFIVKPDWLAAVHFVVMFVVFALAAGFYMKKSEDASGRVPEDRWTVPGLTHAKEVISGRVGPPTEE